MRGDDEDRDKMAAPDERPSLLARLRSHVLPETPDFYRLLVVQSELMCRGTEQLVSFLRTADPAAGQEVRRLEHEGDRVKAANLETLHRSFATPMDREDFYQAVTSIDEVLNYAKTSVREIDVLGLTPDPHMAAIAELVDAGARALLEGFRQLQHAPEAADLQAERARKSERAAEKAYRRALAELLDPAAQRQRLETARARAGALEPDPAFEALAIVSELLKRREIYRHLSNAADHVAHAAQVLADIVNKST
jgi:uncharacterized protein Yka (UPF0111/DUF47 family)